jgi:EmrB/QacA subfamily drug resistance transporter
VTTTAPATDHYPVAAMTAIALASLVVLMDTTFIVLALPVITEDLGAGSGVEWAVTAFLMTAGISQVAVGWLAERFGERRVFLAAVAAFGVFAIAVATSPNLGWLVAARGLQGLCAGLIVPLATSITFAMFPEGRRATAVGIAGTMVMLGPLLAPLLSGWVLAAANWRLLILIDAPLVAVVVGLGAAMIPVHGDGEPRPRPFDFIGMALVATGLVALLLGFSEADRWPVPLSVSICVVGGSLLFAYRHHAGRAAHPLIDLAVVRVPTVRLVLGIVATVAVAQFARTVFIPLELQSLRGLSALETGLALLPAAVASAVAMPLGGQWTDRSGGRAPATFGLVLVTVSAAAFGTLRVDTPLAVVMVLMVINNVGIVMCTMPVVVIGLSAVADRLVPQASALRSLTRQVSGALGTAVLATIITAQVDELTPVSASAAELGDAQRAYNRGFLVSAGIASVGLVLARFLPDRVSVQRSEPVIE